MCEKNPYADILHLPHHQAADRKHMSMHDRAAQFSPFAALTGFDGVIAETGRLTDHKIELSENEKVLLDQKLNLIAEAIRTGQHPEITVLYFTPDTRKTGGAYQEHTGSVRQIDPIERTIVFLADNGRSVGKRIEIDDVKKIHGELVEHLDCYD